MVMKKYRTKDKNDDVIIEEFLIALNNYYQVLRDSIQVEDYMKCAMIQDVIENETKIFVDHFKLCNEDKEFISEIDRKYKKKYLKIE